jgi:hypothetical protein
MVFAALRIHPDNDILWAMFSRLLFGPESHQNLRRMRTSCEGERKGRDEQSRRGPRQHRQIRPPYSTFWRAEELINRGVPHARLFRDMAGVAAGYRRDSALGVRPANKGCLAEDTLPFMGFGA